MTFDCARLIMHPDYQEHVVTRAEMPLANTMLTVGGLRRFSSALLKNYNDLITKGVLESNSYQEKVLNDLNVIFNEIHLPRSELPFFAKLFGVSTFSNQKQGAYIYGDVGSGKTMLMDLFYNSSFISSKCRVHCNQFMNDIHKELHRMKSLSRRRSCPVEYLGQQIGRKWKLLCLDEFQVLDIADAMILRGILNGILSSGTVLMITSNRAPTELYMNGIQRASFLPCISLIENKLKVIDLNAGKDYRLILSPDQSRFTFFSPINDDTTKSFDSWAQRLCPVAYENSIEAMGRRITIRKCNGTCAIFDFDELFRVPMSSVDYLAIVNSFSTIMLKNVPMFTTMDMREEARRFITFLDIIYDTKRCLIVQAAGEIDELFRLRGKAFGHTNLEIADYLTDLGSGNSATEASIFTGAEEKFAAARAISRLHEITTDIQGGSIGGNPSQFMRFVSQLIRRASNWAARPKPKTQPNSAIPNMAGSPLSDRTYKEELYSARRFYAQGENSSFALSRFSNQFRKDGLVDEVKKRRQFTRPSVIRVRNLFASRQRRFNEMVKGTVNKILSIYESQKDSKK